MRNFYWLLPLLLVALVSCGGGDGETPPEPPPVTTTVPGEPPPETPADCSVDTPPAERRPSCYLTLERVHGGLEVRLGFEAQETIWTARNFLWAANTANCDVTRPPYETTPEELSHYSRELFRLYYGRDSEEEVRERGPVHPSFITWGSRFDVNRRCREGDESPWCGRTDAYKPVWEPWFTAWNSTREEAGEIDGRGNHLGYDGLRHFCIATQSR